jgi:hypothetical protein
MKVLELGRHALCASIAAAMLAGCGASQLPIAAPGAMPQGAPAQSRATRDHVAGPDVYKVSSPLLYVADWIKSKIQIFDAKAQNPSPIATITWESMSPLVTASMRRVRSTLPTR